VHGHVRSGLAHPGDDGEGPVVVLEVVAHLTVPLEDAHAGVAPVLRRVKVLTQEVVGVRLLGRIGRSGDGRVSARLSGRWTGVSGAQSRFARGPVRRISGSFGASPPMDRASAQFVRATFRVIPN